jgi:ABC-type branched-subunit amino acid transport system ATPase component
MSILRAHNLHHGYTSSGILTRKHHVQVLRGLSASACRTRVVELLQQVQFSPGDAEKLPSQMRGGQLQRVGIARALAESIIVEDHPVVPGMRFNHPAGRELQAAVLPAEPKPRFRETAGLTAKQA